MIAQLGFVDLVSLWSQTIVATIALLGYFGRAVYRYWLRPVVGLRKCENISFHLPTIDEPKASGMNKYQSLEYLVPVDNTGRGVAMHCTASIDCILTKGDDGDSLNVHYFGLPLLLKWHPNNLTMDLPGHSAAFLRLVSFSEMQDGQNEHSDADSEEAKRCVMLYANAEEKFDCLPVSIGQPVRAYLRISTRAENAKSEESEWLLVHWSGGDEVTANNFKIRLATKEESIQASTKYSQIRTRGEYK